MNLVCSIVMVTAIVLITVITYRITNCYHEGIERDLQEKIHRLDCELVVLKSKHQPNKQVIRQRPQRECVTNYFVENCKDCGFSKECEKLIRKTDMHGNVVTLCDVINNRL